MPPEVRSLHAAGHSGHGETIAVLLEGLAFRAESIVSRGEASPPGFWYDQDLPEWVALLAGAAALEFEDGTLDLAAGDWLVIPAGLRHRVAATSADAVWLALHFQPASD